MVPRSLIPKKTRTIKTGKQDSGEEEDQTEAENMVDNEQVTEFYSWYK